MPKKGTSRVTDQQRQKIAAGKLAGKTAREIATATSLAEQTVKHQSVDLRTQMLIRQLKSDHQTQLSRMFKKSLDRVEKLIDHPDPRVALTACNQTIDAVTAGDPPLARLQVETSDPEEGTVTLGELLATLWRAPSGN